MNEAQDPNRSVDGSSVPADSLADKIARTDYLDRSGGGDAESGAHVEAPPRSHDSDGSSLRTSADVAPDGDRAVTRTLGSSPDQDAAAGQTTDASPGISDELLACLSPATRPDALGRIGHYEVLEVLGRGGFGIVFRAFDERLQRVVAIKMLSPQLAAASSARHRFLRETRTAARVRHAHVVQIYAVEEKPVPYLVMEYIPGLTLQQKLNADGPLETGAMLQVALQITRGLAAAHAQGLIHRDIKPGNILLENGGEPHAKLTDFGLARAADDDTLTQSGLIAGTPLYMAPEQAEGKTIDQRVDLFSLGSVFYAMLSGCPPFRASGAMAVLKRVCEDTPPPIRDSVPEVPEWLCNIVAKLHAKKPEDRFQTAAEVADLLAQHLAHLQQPQQVPMPAPVAGPTVDPGVAPGSGRKWRRGRKAVVVAASGLLLLAVVIPFLYVVTRPAESRQQQRPQEEDRQLVKGSDQFFDALNRENIRPRLLALAGRGDPAQAPPELVAMLGDSRFVLPSGGRRSWMAHSSDGGLLAVPCGNEVAVFDTPTGALVRSLRAHTGSVVCTAFSPDGRRLASGSDDDTARVWNVTTGEILATYPGHKDHVWCVTFSPDGKRVASAARNGTLRIWDAATGKELQPLAGHRGPVAWIAFSPDGNRLVSVGSEDKQLLAWDTTNGRLVAERASQHTSRVRHLALNPRGDRMATGSDSELILWTVDWGADEYKPYQTAKTAAGWLSFAPDGRVLFAGTHETTNNTPQTVTRWDVATGEGVGPPMTLQGRDDWALYDLSPDGKTLFATRVQPDVPYVRAYDAHTGQEFFPPEGQSGPVRSVAVTPDGRVIASSGDDRTVKLWDLAKPRPDGSIPFHTLTGHSERIVGLAVSPDGELLASGSADGTVILWSVSNGKQRYVSRGHSIPADGQPLAFGHMAPGMAVTLAVGQEDGTTRLLEVPAGVMPDGSLKVTETVFPRRHQESIRAVAFSPDGRLLALSGHDGQILLCDRDGRRLHTFEAPGAVRAVFSPDGRLLAGVSDHPDAGLRIWNLATREMVGPIRLSYSRNVVSVVFHPEGRLVGTAAHDGTVRFWDSANRAAVFTIGPGPFGSYVHQIAFSPRGGYALTANENGTISILRVPTAPLP